LIRYLLIFWALPLGSFWVWFFLSYLNVGLGTIYFTRSFHELYFELAGQILGVPPATVTLIIAKACLVDTLIIFAIVAVSKRRKIAEWIMRLRANDAVTVPSEGDQVRPAE
jgi:hypothetical protein